MGRLTYGGCFAIIEVPGKSGRPGKEVGHDTDRGVVMPVGLSQLGLSGNLRGR